MNIQGQFDGNGIPSLFGKCWCWYCVFVCSIFWNKYHLHLFLLWFGVCKVFVWCKGSKNLSLYFYINHRLFASISLDSAINIIDGSFAMMAIPTLVSSIILAPKVVAEASKFLAR